MANRVDAAATEHASVVTGDTSKDTVDTQQSPEAGNRTVNAVVSADCADASKVSPKHSMEGNGEGKPVKPGKDVAGKGGDTTKSSDNEVFIPAPPPATNAWTKRMQASCSAAKPLSESTPVDDKHGTAPLPSDSNKPSSAKKQSPKHTPTNHPVKTDPQSSTLRLEGSTQTEGESSAATSKQPSVENTENPSSSKHAVEVKQKRSGEASLKSEVQMKSTSSASDTAPGGCWKKLPAATNVQSISETSVARGSSATKQQPAELSAGELLYRIVDV